MLLDGYQGNAASAEQHDPMDNCSIYAEVCVLNCFCSVHCFVRQMDYVPKAARAKWNSLESVTSFGWSGSAFVGGYLVQRHGFGATFAATATMQVGCPTAILIVVGVLVVGSVRCAENGSLAVFYLRLPATCVHPATPPQLALLSRLQAFALSLMLPLLLLVPAREAAAGPPSPPAVRAKRRGGSARPSDHDAGGDAQPQNSHGAGLAPPGTAGDALEDGLREPLLATPPAPPRPR